MVSFGTGSLGHKVQQTGRTAVKVDCGKRGKLTIRQIAAAAGVTTKAIRLRIQRGVEGEALLLPPHESLRVIHGECRNHVLKRAIRLAREFPEGLPSTAQIMKAEPMCKRQALRWRQAFADMERAA